MNDYKKFLKDRGLNEEEIKDSMDMFYFVKPTGLDTAIEVLKDAAPEIAFHFKMPLEDALATVADKAVASGDIRDFYDGWLFDITPILNDEMKDHDTYDKEYKEYFKTHDLFRNPPEEE